MKVDPAVVWIATVSLFPVTFGIFCIRRRFTKIFSVFLFGFLVLEFVLPFVGFGGNLWWFIHIPSAIILGHDEILERHGVWISSIFHLADLVFWSILFSITMAILLIREKKKSG